MTTVDDSESTDWSLTLSRAAADRGPHPAGPRRGARLTRRLIREVLLAAFDNEFLRPLGDGAVLPRVDGRWS